MPVVSKIMEAEVFCTYITEVRTYTVRTLQRRIGNKRKVARPPQTAGLGEYSRRPPECRPDLLCRYVDDLFLLFSNEDSLNRFFTNINSVHRNIVFTKEIETNNCLHFLDVLIKKTSTGFITSTYRKPTHPGLYSKWSSFVPLHRKQNLVNSLLRRAYDIASSYQLLHTEFMNIKRMLSRNGYPNNFLDRCIQQFLNRKYGVT